GSSTSGRQPTKAPNVESGAGSNLAGSSHRRAHLRHSDCFRGFLHLCQIGRRCRHRGNTSNRCPVARPTWRLDSWPTCPALGPSFATQPIVGIVIIASAPPARVDVMKSSPDWPGFDPVSAMLSKYQSLPRLDAFSCQLYCDVALPPERLVGEFKVFKSEVDAK